MKALHIPRLFVDNRNQYCLFFASRLGGERSRVVNGFVKKEDVLEYLADRNESEIIVFPDKVQDITVCDCYTLDEFASNIKNRWTGIGTRASAVLPQQTCSPRFTQRTATYRTAVTMIIPMRCVWRLWLCSSTVCACFPAIPARIRLWAAEKCS